MKTTPLTMFKGRTEAFSDHLLCIHQLFEKQVGDTPNNIAVIYNETSLTYKELNQRANHLAHYLLSKGIQKEDPIAICLDRSIELVIALLGILKAGGAYVPIEPTYPPKRLVQILTNINTPMVITSKEHLDSLTPYINESQICLVEDKASWEGYGNDNPNIDCHAKDLMYIMYTSGSTGKPKGVMNTHIALNNRLQWMQKEYDLSSNDRVFQKTPYTFDVSVWEFFWPIITGASIVMAKPEGHKDPEYLLRTIKQKHITIIHFVPSMLQIFLDAIKTREDLPLRRVICSGEMLKKSTELQFFSILKEVELYNLYGPTEAAIDVTYWKCNGNRQESIVPIGFPISNINLYILDKELQPVDMGEVGELYIGGVGLARGYYNLPEITNESFIENLLVKGERLYKTGDLCTYRSDGSIEYIGRSDFQVKLRGFRIELNEIELAIEQQNNIKQCVVKSFKEGEEQVLVAYITLKSGNDWNKENIIDDLNEILPEYMIPSFFIKLDTFPLSSNGKLDRKSLTFNLEQQELSNDIIYNSDTERVLAEEWKKILAIEAVNPNESFLALGGNSLFAARLVSIIKTAFSVSLTISDLFEHASIRSLAKLIDHQSDQSELNNTMIDEVDTPDDISFSQQRLWFIDQLEGKTPLYNIPSYINIVGNIKRGLFEGSLEKTLNNHEIFRWNFHSRDGQPLRTVNDNVTCGMDYVDLTKYDLNTARSLSLEMMDKEALKPFNLSNDPLYRFTLYELSNDTYIFFYNFHHTIFDGWSESLFLNDLFMNYDNFDRANEKSYLDYSDYIKGQQQFLYSNSYYQQLKFWEGKLERTRPTTKLFAEQGDVSKKHAGKTMSFRLSDTDVEEFGQYCIKNGVTLFMGLVALYNTLIYRLTNEVDISIGLPLAGRTSDYEKTIGFFINTLVLRNQITQGSTFEQYLSEVKETTLEALSNADVPFDKIVEHINPERSSTRSPFFQYMLAFQNFPESKKEFKEFKINKPQIVDTGTAKFDLTLFIEMADDGGYTGKWEYRTDLFNTQMIERLTSLFQQLLKSVIEHSNIAIEKLPLLPPEDEEKMIYYLNQTSTPFPDVCLHELFERQVRKTPNLIAATYEGNNLTYQELEEKSNQFAHYLKEQEIKFDTPVGLIMDRSLELVIAILGILKAGGAYLPIDTRAPEKRVLHILQDAKAPICITDQNLSYLSNQSIQVISYNMEKYTKYPIDKPEVFVKPEHLVSVYYTSGSTGKPKGVSSTHSGWVNRMCWMQNKHQLEIGETVLQKTTLTFDDAAVEFFWPLMVGGQIALIPPGDHQDPQKTIDYSIYYRVSVVQFVPSMLQMVTDIMTPELKEQLTSLRVVVSSGEALTKELLQQFNKKMVGKLYNSWGATEVSIDSSCYDCPSDEDLSMETKIISVGKPIDNNRVYILNECLHPVPIGVPGHLYIAGVGLARDYLNDPERTRETFIPDPFFEGELMYRTGDRGYFSEKGNIIYLGREDNQIKIRGMRVELGEIENKIREQMGIKNVIVIKDEALDSLIAYYIPMNRKLNIAEIKESLSLQLPDYMIPSYFVHMAEFPVNTNGKVDRKQFPRPVESDLGVNSKFTKPKNQTEERVFEIWKEKMKLQKFGTQDNFFELGGHSLLAVQIVSSLNKHFLTSLSVKQLFDFPTIEGISKILNDHILEQAVYEVSDIDQKLGANIPLSDAQKRIWFLDNLQQDSNYNMPLVLNFSNPIDLKKVNRTLSEIIQRHESLRMIFKAKSGTPYQVVKDSIHVPLKVIHSNDQENIQDIIQTEMKERFNLSEGPLIRGVVIRKMNIDILILILHHIICDGWSLQIIKNDFIKLYGGGSLHDEPKKYSDYAISQYNFSKTDEFQKQLNYWTEQLKDMTPLHIGRKINQKELGNQSLTIKRTLTNSLSDEIKRFSKTNKYTPFMVFHGVFTILLSKISQQSDITLGTPLVNRNSVELEDVVGLFLNSLPLRVKIDKNKGFLQYMEGIKKLVFEAFANQDVPFEKIVEVVQPERNLNRNPLFDILINYRNFEEERVFQIGDTIVEEIEVDEIQPKFFMTLYIEDTGSGYHLTLSYRNDMFLQKQMIELLNQFIHVLETIVVKPELTIENINLMTNEYKKYIPNLNEPLNEKKVLRVTEQINKWVETSPNHIAVEEGGKRYSYCELHQHSALAAKYLLGKGMCSGDVIAIYGKRSYETIISILGVLYGNATFVNIDGNIPKLRLKEMLRQAEVKACISIEEISNEHQRAMNQLNIPIYDVEAVMGKRDLLEYKFIDKRDESDTAYIYFTSGTTGEPKGILGTHNGLSHFIDWQRNKFGINETDRFAQYTHPTFDVYLRDIFLPLCSGATICIPEKEDSVIDFLKKNEITALHTVPSVAKSWINEAKEWLQLDLRLIFFAGEGLPKHLAESWRRISAKSVRIISFYGQTETTLAKSYYEVDEEMPYEFAPLGKSLPETHVFLLNERNELCGCGEVGEIIVRTPYLTKGYLLSGSDTFISNFFTNESSDQLYRTGDLGRYLPDGDIEFIGRNDNQIKIRGIRIDLNEITATINSIEEVKECVIVNEEINGQVILVAYIVPRNIPINASHIRNKLSNILPFTMIPNQFISVPFIPVTRNGKVNLEQLKKFKKDMSQKAEAVPFQYPLERELLFIWKDILLNDEVTNVDNFFDLGGHSLLIIRMLAIIKRELKVDISLRDVFEHPTVHSLASFIAKNDGKRKTSSLQKIKRVSRNIRT